MKNGIEITYLLAILTVFLPVTHNLVYAIFGVEEGLFMLLSIASFILFQVTALLSFFSYRKTGEPQDIWKLAFLGLLGPIYVFIFHLSIGFLGFMGYFGYFSFRKKKATKKA